MTTCKTLYTLAFTNVNGGRALEHNMTREECDLRELVMSRRGASGFARYPQDRHLLPQELAMLKRPL